MSTTTTTKVFITGATGYIGGSVLTLLLQSKKYTITALVRSPEKAALLEKIGVIPLIGDLDDHDKIEKATFESDLVIEVANCDHLGEAKAIVGGLTRKFKETGKKGKYVHTSGTGILVDGAWGEYEGTEIYSDLDTEKVNALPATLPHRHVDTYVIDNSASYDLAVITPSAIYGTGIGPEGIANKFSIAIPLQIKGAIAKREVTMIGQGLNTWNCVHVEDVASLYIIIIDEILKGTLKWVGREGYYFVETGSFHSKDSAALIAKALYNKGAIKTDNVKSIIGKEEAIKESGNEFEQYLAYLVSSNSRCKAEKAYQLGWSPKYIGVEPFFADIENVITEYLSKL